MKSHITADNRWRSCALSNVWVGVNYTYLQRFFGVHIYIVLTFHQYTLYTWWSHVGLCLVRVGQTLAFGMSTGWSLTPRSLSLVQFLCWASTCTVLRTFRRSRRHVTFACCLHDCMIKCHRYKILQPYYPLHYPQSSLFHSSGWWMKTKRVYAIIYYLRSEVGVSTNTNRLHKEIYTSQWGITLRWLD